MTEQQACTLCGAGGHTAAQCRWNKAEGAQGEREAFEAEVLGLGLPVERDHHGAYVSDHVRHLWSGWELRAALAQPSPAPDQSERNLDMGLDFEHLSRRMLEELAKLGKCLVATADLERLTQERDAAQSRLAELEASLIHIIKTCGQSRTETRRLRWIAQRAQWALDGKEYEDSAFDLPKDATGSNEKLAREVKELRARLAELEKQEPVAWALQRKRDGFVRATWHQKPSETQYEIAELDGDVIAPLYAAPAAQAGQVPEGYALIPTRLLLDKELIECIAFHCGDGGGPYGDYQDGILFIGEITDDDGRKVHGLHLACAECEEEGYTTLVEFAAAPAQGGA
ncbi:hypothetical protein [Pseudomonas pseudonitroreducens]|uniref:hypothetical protein n=1 Tax=Pseudomonas pseudonitroreducens TaxID=2892326 RepID=UPI001F27DC55|nr:hypothetical protein [Pseudomonas pseudonitroreducens]